MRGPDLKKLVRSLRTKSYEKLPIRKYLVTLAQRSESSVDTVPSKQEFGSRKEPHGKVEPD